MIRVSKHLAAAAANTFARWGIEPPPHLTRIEIGECLGISLGLSAIFDENAVAEKKWIWTPRKVFRGTAARMIMERRFTEVLSQVNFERGL